MQYDYICNIYISILLLYFFSVLCYVECLIGYIVMGS